MSFHLISYSFIVPLFSAIFALLKFAFYFYCTFILSYFGIIIVVLFSSIYVFVPSISFLFYSVCCLCTLMLSSFIIIFCYFIVVAFSCIFFLFSSILFLFLVFFCLCIFMVS